MYIYSPYSVHKITGLQTIQSPYTSTINYTLSNGLVIHETDGTYVIIYTYDYDGTLISFHYDNDQLDATPGQEYFYIHNLQGDVIKIIDALGQIVIEYHYDGYGNIINDIESNPFYDINHYTYRGYCYDQEIGLFYCNARYYQPTIGRWLNADSVHYLDPMNTNGLNLFAYCGNNPVMRRDPSGYAWWHWAIAAGIVVGIGVALVLTAGGAAPALVALTQVGYGFAASSMATTVLAGAFIGSSIALGATVMYAMSNANSLDEFAEQGNWGTVAVTATGGLIGAGTGYLTFANYGYTQYGDKTPVKSFPFGSYHNAKEHSVTHYGINGKMLWSKHFTDHGNFGKFFHNNPHWHTELPHSKGYNTLWEFLKALVEKMF